MLDPETIRNIESFIYAKPRSVQEIAHYIGKNWRTADRYINEIENDFGTISTRVFRKGTRGALKIVYWAAVEKISHSIFQEILEHEIMQARKKEDFFAFDIAQHIPGKNKKSFIEKSPNETLKNLKELDEFLKNTKRQLLIFSGNLSFINLKNKDIDIFRTLDDLAKRKITMKIICRVDIPGKENIEKILSLNFKYGKEVLEIRHRRHPLRAIVSDNSVFKIIEIKEPTGKEHELKKEISIVYTIKDKEWTEWISRIFWKMYSSSIDARKRLEEINKLK